MVDDFHNESRPARWTAYLEYVAGRGPLPEVPAVVYVVGTGALRVGTLLVHILLPQFGTVSGY
jgi:hypothetical protein